MTGQLAQLLKMPVYGQRLLLPFLTHLALVMCGRPEKVSSIACNVAGCHVGDESVEGRQWEQNLCTIW